MKEGKKLLSLSLAAAMTLGLAAPAMAAEETTAPEQGKIVILHTNDVHCQIDQAKEEDGSISAIGYAGVAAYKAEMAAKYGAENVTLVDSGDAIQGGPIGTLSKGSYIVDIMNEVGYDLAIPGNHEFDYGMDNFLSLAKDKAKYDYLCCNFTDLNGKSVLDAYKLVEYGDVTVGYVGIDTPESFTKSTPTYFQNDKGEYIYSFSQGNEGKDLYDAVQKAVDDATKAGADYVVALGHLGNEGSTDVWTSKSVIANTTGIDVFIDGHSHETYDETVKNKSGEDVTLAQTGTKLANIGKVVIDTKTGEVTSELVSGYDKQDEGTAAYIAKVNEEFAGVLQKVVAKSDVALTIKDPATDKRAVRNAETNLGDLCADAYRVMLGADVAFVNGGGVRADIAAGDITYEAIINVHPFGNEACLVETTGQDILDALEMGARLYPEENGGFLQVSGLSYNIDPSVPSSVVLSDEGEFVKVDGAYRVTDVKVGGEPLDLSKTYTLASHNYMLKSGGDGFVMFKDDKLLKDSVMIDNAVLINYIVDELDGVVSDAYADPKGQGRITFNKGTASQGTSYSDVTADAWYAGAVKYVSEEGLMSGTGKGLFAPAGTVTRGMVYQTLYNMVGKPAVAEKASFTDVEGKWYADAAAWAEDEGLTTGVSKGLFGGERAMTRQELAKVFSDYAAVKCVLPAEKADLSAFTDRDQIAAWAQDGMEDAVALGILSGNKGKLNPTGTAQRAELAQILKNFDALEPTYVETVVSIEVPAQDGIPAHTVPGTLTLPTSASKDAKVPGVVMLHGTGSNRQEAGNGYAMAAPVMATQGVATLRIDFMGNGDSKADYKDYNNTSAVIDAKAAADYLAGLETVDGKNLGVMGWSQGGTDALLAAETHPETFKAVVTWSGALYLGMTEDEEFQAAYETAKKDGYYVQTYDWREPLHIGERWYKEVAETDMLKIVSGIKAPILAINGKNDTTVTPDNAEKIVEASSNEASKVLLVDNCDHTYNVFSGDFTALFQTVDATIAFFQSQLIPAAAQAAA